jgi:hypothetical protein
MQSMLSYPVYWIASSFQCLKHRIDLGEVIQTVNNTERLYLHHPVQCFLGYLVHWSKNGWTGWVHGIGQSPFGCRGGGGVLSATSKT